jgi:catechol 2,3-dioxygenase-like lactoylglutathione lyase family enzyme
MSPQPPLPAKGPRIRPLYTGLRVRKLDHSIRFYKTLGFRQTLRGKTDIGEYSQLEHRSSGFTIELNYFPKGSKVYEPLRKGTELDHFGLEVDDVDDWVDKLRRVGGKVKWKPFDCQIVIYRRGIFNDRAAYVSDPDGIWIELLGPRRSRPRANG